MSDLPAKTDLSDKISSDLKKRGFKFMGSTISYALLQASGIINDHTTDCFRYNKV
jgi:DNA-3-methyladenine glycosylase I